MARTLAPVKRPVEELSDSDEYESETPVKRVKREKFEDAHTARRHEEEEDSDLLSGDGETEDEMEGSDESESDEEYPVNEYLDDEANVRAYTAAKEREKRFGSLIPEAGYIEKVIVQNFMCHQNTHVDFSKRLNFLVGHNGSGKSAILTAITVALGGKAATTGRGSGLRDLIRKGCDKAVITLIMGNSGPQAYRPEVYDQGKIIIERTIDKVSGGAYRFKAKIGDRKNVASKREELTHMCQHFSITIDSPLTVLTQDAARSFLQSADEQHLYKFFLQGTGLGDLTRSYQETKRRLDEIELVLHKQDDLMKSVDQNIERLNKAVGAAKALTEQKKEYKRTTCELAWAYVTQKEIEVEDAKRKSEMLQKKLDEVKESMRSCKATFDALDEQTRELEDEQKRLFDSQKPVKESHTRLLDNLGQRQRVERDIQSGISDAEKSIKNFQRTIDSLTRKIDDRLKAIDAAVDPAETALRAKIEIMTEDLRSTRASIPIKEEAYNTKTSEVDAAKTQLAHAEREVESVTASLRRSENLLRNSESQKGNRVRAFGENIDLVMNDINAAKWEHSKPIGPLGMHVTLLDPHYKDALTVTLGNMMCSFAVRTPRDRQTMLSILRRRSEQPNGYKATTSSNTRGGFPPVITHAGDIFDFSRGDRSRHGPTILSKIRVDNEEVLRMLINSNKIEAIFVSPTIHRADAEMDAMFGRGLDRCQFLTADGFTTNGTRDSRTSGPIGKWGGGNLFATDMAREIQDRKAEVQAQTESLQAARIRAGELHQQVQALEQEARAARDDFVTTKKRRDAMERELNNMQAKLPIRSETDIASWESSRTMQQTQRGEVVTQLEELKHSLEETVADREIMQTELAEVQQKIDDFEPEKRRQQDAMLAMTTQRAQVANNMSHWDKSRKTTEDAKAAADEDVLTFVNDLTSWTTKAANFSERFETERSIKVLDALIKKQSIDIEAAKKRSGVNIDDLHAQLRDANIAKRKMNQSMKSLRALCTLAGKGLKRRTHWWASHRSHTSVKARTSFIINLQKREQNFTGKLDFDHNSEKLKMVFTSKQKGSSVNDDTNSIVKSAQNLSGGERSFATVSLLLALWDTVNSPLSCLDEWDVFLDAANRKVASGMLLDGAKDSDGRQYIFISPLSMQGTACGTHDRVIKLGDPERGQRQLEFERSQRR